ncbi:hypothetical protein R1sor_013826 [Riccia sorocarpa]|uniref:Uncharacterized protein n=1 Tax=Riccia sorocarpa TaxID=122646 RepID=A0ABD3HAA6_9MARC
MIRQEELTTEAPVEENETPKPPAENVVSGGSPGNVDCEAYSPGYTPYSPEYVPNGPLMTRQENLLALPCGRKGLTARSRRIKIRLPRWLKAKGSEREAIRANSGRQIEVLVMASTDPVDKKARLRAVGGDEAAKVRVRLRDDIELQLESATAKLFNAESHIVKALYDGNNELAEREIYDAHGKSQDARCHIRRAMQLVNYVLAPEDDTLDGRWKKKFGELEADDEVSAMEIVEDLCKCDETNPPVPGWLVHDDQGKLR